MQKYGFIEAKDQRYISDKASKLMQDGLMYRYKNKDDFWITFVFIYHLAPFELIRVCEIGEEKGCKIYLNRYFRMLII